MKVIVKYPHPNDPEKDHVRTYGHSKSGHRTEMRVYRRDIHESFCMQKGCKFYGKPAQQGVCHTTPADIAEERKHRSVEEIARDHVAWLQKSYGKLPKKKYIHILLTEVLCMTMNDWYRLDELVRLRGKVALLDAKSKKRSK